MIEAILIFVVSLIPSLLSLVMVSRAKKRWEADLMQVRSSTIYWQAARLEMPDLEAETRILGDTTCKFNARSPYLRCAVNPSGSCEDCYHYEPR